jgi:glycosyltransferase involved in cell wall biosynthesis
LPSLTPQISVILIAHDRKAYLLQAMESLLNQTLPRVFYEVIVVKNFKDERIDNFLELNGFLGIFTHASEVGSKLAIGILHSQGDVITFLEDDDIFEVEKLETILRYFSNDPNLCFLHNSMSSINDSGCFIDFHSMKSITAVFKYNDSYLMTCKMFGIKPTDIIYTSCMSLRKMTLEPYIQALSKIQSAPDYFMVLAFLNYGCEGLHIPDKLTRYRVHESQSIRLGSYDTFQKRNIDIRARWIKDYNLMASTFQNKNVKDLATFLKNYNNLFLLNMAKYRNVRMKFTALIALFGQIQTVRFFEPLRLLFFTFGTILSPRAFLKLYYLFKLNKYSGNRK